VYTSSQSFRRCSEQDFRKTRKTRELYHSVHKNERNNLKNEWKNLYRPEYGIFFHNFSMSAELWKVQLSTEQLENQRHAHDAFVVVRINLDKLLECDLPVVENFISHVGVGV